MLQVKQIHNFLKKNGWQMIGGYTHPIAGPISIYHHLLDDEIHVDANGGYSYVTVPDMALEQFVNEYEPS